MSNLLTTMKKIVHDTVKSMILSDNLIGTVVSVNPLKIAISEKIVLEEVHFLKLKNVIGDFPVEVRSNEGMWRGECKHRLKKGSKVVLNRSLGGEQYVILGELIE